VLAAPLSASAYPWPVKPFHRQHAIRGNFDDPRSLRGFVDLRARYPLTFHSGVDIQAPDGTPVYAVAPGVVHPAPQHIAVVAGGIAFGYWHVDAAVRAYEHVRRGQLIGYIHPGAGHVHLSERRHGRYVNPLRRGGLAPYADHTPPVVVRLVVFRSGTTTLLSPDAVSGTVDLAVDSYDPPSVAPTGLWSGAVVTPARVSWSGLFAGSWLPLAYKADVVDFTRFPKRRAQDVYAPGTYQNEPGEPGIYRFWLVRNLDTSMLADGLKTIRVTASDIRGNATTREFTFTVGESDGAAGESG